MSKRANPTAIGAFVVSAVALAVVGIITLGGMQIFKKELPFVMFFDGDLGGLDVGAPVEIRGVKIGAVTKIRLFANTNRIGVYVNIDPSLLPRGGKVRQNAEAVEDLIKQGLRAQLKTQSMLTGQLLVYLDFFPGISVALVGLDPDVPEIPTVPTTLARLQAQVEAIFNKLDKVKFDELINDVSLTLKGAKDLMASPELKAAVVSANTALQQADKTLKRLDAQLELLGSKTDATLVETRELLAETRKFLANVDAQIGPLAASIKDASTSAQGTLRTVDRAVDGDSRLGYEALRTLRDVADAARSLKALADYLERHPDALLRGKGGSDSE
ncbi:MAG TPA: MlaD family protein [Methylomirabilota bacterium]|nr:MlaD family protein [Methylomirabilota bacterium]